MAMDPDQLDASLDRIAQALNGLVDVDSADELVGFIRPKIPRRTGRLADSLDVQQTPNGVAVVAGGPAAPYGPFVLGGLFNQAADAHLDQVVDDTVDHLRRVIERS